MTGILITDDHPLFMLGLDTALRLRKSELQVYQATHLDSAKLHIKQQSSITLMLLDRTLPGIDSLNHLEEFWEINPNLRIAIISAADSRHQIQEAINAGVVGFISKSASPHAILDAIDLLLQGRIYVPDTLFRSPTPLSCIASLSQRQNEILQLAAEGYTNKQIAKETALTEGTVKQHFNAILKALSVNNRTQAIQTARMRGLVR